MDQVFDGLGRSAAPKQRLKPGDHLVHQPAFAIGGVGLHVGVLKLNDSERAIHEYIAMGASGVFSLRCQATDILTFGLDTNVSVDFYDAVKHVNALDFAINVGLTLTIGLTF